jgi:hypothetical protein
MKHAIILSLYLLAGGLYAQETNTVAVTKEEQKRLNRISMKSVEPQRRLKPEAVHTIVSSTAAVRKADRVAVLVAAADAVTAGSRVPCLTEVPLPVFMPDSAYVLPSYFYAAKIGQIPSARIKEIPRTVYEYRLAFREDVLEVYPELITRRAADQTYFGYLEFTISRALSEKNFELADELAARYVREWDRLKPTGERHKRPR